jgi:AcrR family transcriptional regulator
MPKKTFLNLDESKRKQITDAFLREFAVKSFDEASLTIVVKRLGIAKGSIYQYFEGKLDLFLYLIGECTSTKMKHLGSIARKDYPDFWLFFRALFEHGFQFDNENALQSHFLFNLTDNLNSPSIKHLYEEMLEQSVVGFEKMVKHEVALGLFREDVPIKIMGFMLYKIGVSIQENLMFSEVINPKKSIEKNMPVYQGKREELMQTVDDFIRLVKPSFDKNRNLK